MEIELLADNESAVPLLARWYFDEWGHLNKGNSLQKVTEKLYGYLNSNKIPLIVLAIENGQVIGASQLKYREMDIYPDREHWLGGVYVCAEHRGKWVAERLIRRVISIASELGVKKLHLQTIRMDGRLHSRLGWKPDGQVKYHGLDVLVMHRDIDACQVRSLNLHS